MASRVALLLLFVMLAGCGRASPPPESREAGRLGRVEMYRPAGAPRALVFLFSDAAGWSPEWTQAAERLQAAGAAVVGVDLPSYLEGLRASDDGCHYVIAELEDRSKRWQRELGVSAYRSPVLAGAGPGGTLALAALAQAPAATVAGAWVADPAPSLATRVPFCPGAPSHPAPGGGFSYDVPQTLPGFVRQAPAGPAPAPERLAMALAAGLEADAGSTGGLHGLPLIELPSAQPGPFLAVIFSGDGGWRDLDKTVGEWLASHGVAVVGVDSLRYFWNAKSPDRVAADLAEIMRHYGALWNRPQVALVGYSFGAGVLPFALNRLPDAERARVVQLTLLGLEPKAPFTFHVAGWLEQMGVKTAEQDALPVLPELLRIDRGLVQCVEGDQEPDSLCRAPELAGIERIVTHGSHHFDGDYPGLARRILDGLQRRAAARSAP